MALDIHHPPQKLNTRCARAFMAFALCRMRITVPSVSKDIKGCHTWKDVSCSYLAP